MTGPVKQARKDRELDALAFNVLSSFRHQGAMQWTDWYETTRTRRGKQGLGPGTFSEIVKRLTAKGRVQMDGDGCYQAVFKATGDALDAMVDTLSTANSLAVETKCFSEVISEVVREGGNGNADIADIALRQLMDREVQDS